MKGSSSVKIYSSIACFYNALLWTLDISVSHELLRKNHRADSRAMPGKNKQWFYISRRTVHLFRHTSPILFYYALFVPFFSKTRTAFASFRAQKPTGIKSGSVFPILNGQLEAAFPMKSSISTLNLRRSPRCTPRRRKTRELWPSGCCAP